MQKELLDRYVRQSLKLVLFIVLFALSAGASAQLAFIPDPAMRSWLNSRIPGVVDAQGNMNTAHPGIPGLLFADLLAIPFIGPSDLTGLEYLTGLQRLQLTGGGNDFILPAFPPNLVELELSLVGVATLPPLPATLLRLDVFNGGDLTNLPAYPSGLLHLRLSNLEWIDMIGPLPASLQNLWIQHMPLLVSLPELPIGLLELSLEQCPIDELPVLPIGLELLVLRALPQLSALPSLPTGMYTVRLLNLPLIGTLPPWPAACETLSLHGLPQVSNVPSLPAAVRTFSMGACPLLPDWPAIPQTVTSLALREQSFPTLPVLPSGLSDITLEGLPAIEQLPTWPVQLETITLRALPGITLLPMLPTGLQWLHLENCPALSALPPIPSGLSGLYLIDCNAVPCLPPLPDDLWDLTVQSTTIDCLPGPLGPFTWAELSFDQSNICTEPCLTDDPLIGGRVVHDANGNGMIDAGELPLPGAIVTVMPSGLQVGTDAAGRYRAQLPPGSYILDAAMPVAFAQASVPSTLMLDVEQDAVPDTTNHFALSLEAGHTDLAVSLTATDPRPGFENMVWVQVRNMGSEPSGGQLTLVLDDIQNLVAATPVPATEVGNTLNWSLPSLGIGQQWTAQVRMLTPIGTVLGIVLNSTATLAVPDDEQLENDLATLTQEVVGSFDPNDKLVAPAGLSLAQVIAGERLHYTIRFQNTGTAPAEFVVIDDTLSPMLNASTFTFVGSSHSCTWQRHGSLLRFRFDDIQLPDSVNDEPGSHGYVRFSIEPSASLLPGAEIPNAAAIYFDFNEPVITEPVVCEVVLTTSIAGDHSNELTVYPVPANDRLTIVSTLLLPGTLVEVLDTEGRVVIQRNLANGWGLLDISAIVPGVYLLRIATEGGSAIARFVKE